MSWITIQEWSRRCWNRRHRRRHCTSQRKVPIGRILRYQCHQLFSTKNYEIETAQSFDFCIVQLLLSIVGGPNERRQALETAFHALSSSEPGGTFFFLSCSGVSDYINENYSRLVKDTRILQEMQPVDLSCTRHILQFSNRKHSYVM